MNIFVKTIVLLVLTTTTSFASCKWVHFKNEASIEDVSRVLRTNHLLSARILSQPFRAEVCEDVASKLASIQGDDKVLQVEDFANPQFEYKFHSPFNFTVDERDKWTRNVAIAVPLIVTVYGSALWDWGQDGLKFGFGNEGWFNKDSYSGGADKVGHMMSLYIDKRMITWLALQSGHDFRTAQNYGLLASGFVGLAFEVGDAISKYRFSMEDLFMDSVGIGFAWLLDEYPKLDELVGLRWEWWPSKEYRDPRNQDKGDISSDYSGQKIYFSLKSAGVPLLKESIWTRYATLDLGFHTRGYEPDLTPDNKEDNNRHRYYSVGIGLNIGSLIWESNPNNSWSRSLGSLTKYWIPPGVTHNFVRKEL